MYGCHVALSHFSKRKLLAFNFLPSLPKTVMGWLRANVHYFNNVLTELVELKSLLHVPPFIKENKVSLV